MAKIPTTLKFVEPLTNDNATRELRAPLEPKKNEPLALGCGKGE